MSMDYWVIQGIGVDTGDLRFNNEKLKRLIREQFPNEEDLLERLDKGKFDIDDYLYGDCFENLADLLTFCDDTDTLTYGDDGDGGYYFYYPPSMPWELTPNDPISCKEVHKNIINAVQRVSDMTADEIEATIHDELYVVGCG